MSTGRSVQRLLMSGFLGAVLAAAAPAHAQQAPAPKPAAPKAQPAPAAKPAPAPKAAEDSAAKEEGKAEGVGLSIPRFVSLRAEPINMRVGPGTTYPVEWVYRRRYLPVEVIAESDNWRKIRDPDGAEGWVSMAMLTGRRTAMVKGELRPLRRTNTEESDRVASLEPGVIVTVQRCPKDSPFCRVEINGLQGWLKRDEVWGVYPDELVE